MFAFCQYEGGTVHILGEVFSEGSGLVRIQVVDLVPFIMLHEWELTSEIYEVPKDCCRFFLDRDEAMSVARELNQEWLESRT